MRRRRKKILNLVAIASETGISKQDFDNMLDFEKKLFEELMKCIDYSDKEMNQSLNGQNGKHKNELVIFREDIKEFVGLNGEKMSFGKNEIANIPKEIADILIADGKAERAEE